MTSAPAARSRRRRSRAAMPKQSIRPSPGPRHGASVPALRRPRSASTSASSPLTSPLARPSTFTTSSIAPGAGPMHKTQLASDRTKCRSPLANQTRLILHTAAYWPMLTVRDAIPKRTFSPPPSLPPSACVFSSSVLAASKRPCEFISPSPPRVRMPHYSGSLPPQSFPPRLDTRGHHPVEPILKTHNASQKVHPNRGETKREDAPSIKSPQKSIPT
jgi:hypothetical protein